MADDPKGSSPTGTASLLVTEGVVDVLQEKGMLNTADAEKALRKAQTQAAKLSPALIRRDKVLAIIAAMMQRLRRGQIPETERPGRPG